MTSSSTLAAFSPLALVQSVWRNRLLIRQMSQREFAARYRGSFMGLTWSFVYPIFMLFIYTFVFSVVFKARWGIGAEESKINFAIILFVGLIIHGLFADCINRAPGLILANVNYVKKVVFPLEILPVVALVSAFVQFLIGIIVLLVAFAVMYGFLHWTLIFLPLVLMPFFIATLGITWFLASLGVFVRDIGQVTGIFTTALMFLSPIFYPISALPAYIQPWMMANPLTFIIEQARAIFLKGQLPDWQGMVIYFLVSGAICWAGFWWFQKTRKGFADVI
jgi:lipopolysaccharide transport system permease protein